MQKLIRLTVALCFGACASTALAGAPAAVGPAKVAVSASGIGAADEPVSKHARDEARGSEAGEVLRARPRIR